MTETWNPGIFLNHQEIYFGVGFARGSATGYFFKGIGIFEKVPRPLAILPVLEIPVGNLGGIWLVLP